MTGGVTGRMIRPVTPPRPIRAAAGGGQHAPVPDQHHPGDPEPVLDLGHLAGHGHGVPGVAGKDLDGDRDALGGGQQAVDDLQPTPHPVLRVADGALRAGLALERGAGHVIQDQGAAGQVPGRRRVLDLLLPGLQPVHRRVQVILITRARGPHPGNWRRSGRAARGRWPAWSPAWSPARPPSPPPGPGAGTRPTHRAPDEALKPPSGAHLGQIRTLPAGITNCAHRVRRAADADGSPFPSGRWRPRRRPAGGRPPGASPCPRA